MTLERILVVDYESKSVHLLRQILTTAGYTVTTTIKGERAVELAAEEAPSMVIAEAFLPGKVNGFELARHIRQFSEIPIILLSDNAEPEHVLRGFDAGADDYIAKPYDGRILLARVKAVLKRRQGGQVVPVEICFNNFVINLAAMTVSQNGIEIYLTETEYNLLLELVRHRDQVMLHEQLLIAVWGPKLRGEIDYLRSYIHILRRKLEGNPSQPRLIVSRPGIGYMLVTSPTTTAGG